MSKELSNCSSSIASCSAESSGEAVKHQHGVAQRHRLRCLEALGGPAKVHLRQALAEMRLALHRNSDDVGELCHVPPVPCKVTWSSKNAQG